MGTLEEHYSEYILQKAILILTFHSNEKRSKTSQNQHKITLSSLLRRNSDVFSAIFHCLIDEKPMAFRRHYTLSSAIYRKEIKRIVGSKTYNRLIPSILSNSSKSAYFKPTTDLLTNSPFSEAI